MLEVLFNDVKANSKSRVRLETVATAKPLHTAAERARKTLGNKDLVVVGRKPGSGWKMQDELLSIFAETSFSDDAHPHRNKGSSNSEMRKVFGDVSYGMISTGVKASLLVVQAKREA